MERNLEHTQFFTVESEQETGVQLVLSAVYEALTEKGYNPVNQIVGYRDELVEEMLRFYIENKLENQQ